MATSQAEVTARHAAQIGVAAVMAHELRGAVANLDLRNLRDSLPTLTALVAALTRRYGAASATLAVQHYTETRTAAGVTGRFSPRPADPPPLPQVQSLVGWATRDLWTPTAPAVAPQAPSAPSSPAPTPAEALQAAERDIVAGAERLVLNQGRQTTVENVREDRKARAWAREVRPGCCSFCALMASRGATYKSEASAGRDANQRFTGGGEFKFHNNCHCDVVPVFGEFEMSATAREAAAVYANRGKGDAMNAFRRDWEARDKDPETRRKSSKPAVSNRKGAPQPVDPNRDVDASRTTEELKATLAALEASLAKFDSPGTRKRVEELREKIAARR